MPNLARAIALAVIASTTAARAANHAPVVVYLDRAGGMTEHGVAIPAFGGGERVWQQVVACVREQYAPFAVELVTSPPRGTHITAMVGGKASLLGLDDATTNGVGPYNGRILRNATVHIFSQVGSGERDVENLCAITAHEVGHVLGLDHEVLCGDIMSYYGAQCGSRRFIDQAAPCGEASERKCGSGFATQSSYGRLGVLVGFRAGAAPAVRQPPRVVPRPQILPQGSGYDDVPRTLARRARHRLHRRWRQAYN